MNVKPVEYKQYIAEYGVDLTKVISWRWPGNIVFEHKAG
jgi:hypothetical protein